MSEPLSAPLTPAAALQQARALGVDRLDAQVLLSTLLQRPRSWLLAHDQDALDPLVGKRFTALLQRRALGEPLAYLLGDKEFFGLTLRVTPDTLIPRPDTETLVEWALQCLPTTPTERPLEVLDLGTGSGAIALALKHQRPHAHVVAVDASAGALAVAQSNARTLGLDLETHWGSWFEPVQARRFDLIVSNPPYIAQGDPHMTALKFEPEQALTSGPDGLDDIRHLVAHAPAHLKPGGWLLLEHGWDQAPAVNALLTAQGFTHITTRLDLGGQVRCTGGQTHP